MVPDASLGAKKLGFIRLEHDHSVFVNKKTNTIVAAYVDDLLFIARDKQSVDLVKKQLDTRFNIKHMGELKEYLGMQIVRNKDEHTIQINQSRYIKQLLQQLGLENCSSVKSPMEQGLHLITPPDYTATADEISEYKSLTGPLGWLSIMTRPDITYAVGVLQRVYANPHPNHMHAAKRVLRYLAGTVDTGLTYGPGKGGYSNDGLAGYTDTSYCDDYKTSRSPIGYVFKLFNGPIEWKFRLEDLVTTSACEAEYVAAHEACKEGLHFGPLLMEMGIYIDIGNWCQVVDQSDQSIWLPIVWMIQYLKIKIVKWWIEILWFYLDDN